MFPLEQLNVPILRGQGDDGLYLYVKSFKNHLHKYISGTIEVKKDIVHIISISRIHVTC